MSRSLRKVAAVMLSAVLLAACSSERPGPPAPAGHAEPKSGGQVIYLNEKLIDGTNSS